jgi:sugar phosphate isomerase/epimerase
MQNDEHYKLNWIERNAIFWPEVLEKYPPTVVLENTFEPTPEMFRALLGEVSSSRLKVCLDMGHMNVWSKVPLEEWIAVLGEDIHSMHIHDNKGDYDYHLVPGKGTINWQEFSDLIAKYQIDPDIVFEVKTLETTIQSLKYFREENLYPFNTFTGHSM